MMKKMRKEDTSKEISLQELVEDGALCPFSSSKNELYCSICTDGVTRNYLLSSPSFRVAFKSAYKKYTGEVITDIQFKYKLDDLEVMAFENKLSYMLSNRICKHEDAIFYDLSESENLCVMIKDGITKIKPTPKMLFKRTNIQADQVKPNFSVDETSLSKMLKKHLNIPSKKLRDLYSIWLVSSFFPDIQHMILAVYGEKGSSKSTLLQRTVQIIDPVIKGAELNSLPKKSDLELRLGASLVTAFDNVSSRQLKYISDLFCQSVTGSVAVKKMLYKDTDLISTDLKSIVLLNGTELVISRSDLIERAILIPMKKLSGDKIQNENDMESAFRAELPHILGACLKLVAKASDDIVPITTGHKTRIASFYDTAILVGRAMGFEDEYTDELLMLNGKRGNRETLKNDVMIECLLKLIGENREYRCSMTDLLYRLKEVGKLYNIPLSEFPAISNKLRTRLNMVQSNLKEEYGITYSIHNMGKYKEIRITQNTTTDSSDDV